MSSPQPLAFGWRDLAEDLAHADGLQQALDSTVAETSRLLRARACIVQPVDGDWKVVAQARGGLDLPSADLPPALGGVCLESGIGVLDLRALGRGRWTSIQLPVPDGPPLILLVAGDRDLLSARLADLAIWLPLALTAALEKERRRDAERLAIEVRAMARRMGRLGGVEAVATRVVDQAARSIPADRIALAMHLADEDRLAVVATHGYAAADVRHVRIEPGAGIIGHVYSSGRPLLVRDVRQIGRPSPPVQRPYRTFSFAAVPIAAGGGVMGVLTATDKSDGSAFDRQDKLALRVISGVAAVGLMAARFDREAERLAHAANIDALTALFNRTWFETRLHQEMERARRTGSPLALLMADIDDFKAINDTYGHQAGDSVLQSVGAVLRGAIRVFDVCARIGGDEFAILMPDADLASATRSAERIRQLVSDSCGREGLAPGLQPTLSLGVAVIQGDDTPPRLLRRADECLYLAKAAGKNAVRASIGAERRHLPAAPADAAWMWPSSTDE